MRIRFATQSYRSTARKLSAQRCANMYTERQSADAKTDIAVLSCPGILDFATCGTGPLRGMWEFGDFVYAVSGTTLYRVDDQGAATNVGGAVTGIDPVIIDDNGEQIFIANGTDGYTYSIAGGFARVTDANFIAGRSVTNTDGFFMVDRAGTNEFAMSDSLDGTSWDGSFFASAEWKSDNVVRLLNHLERLNIFGERSTEVWGFTGAVNFPYQRIKGAGLEIGLIGPYALCTDSESIYIIGDDRAVYRAVGGGAQQISNTNPAIEAEWQSYRVIDDAICFSHMWEGHQFVYFTFPTQNVTFCLDRNTGLFHERFSLDEFNNSLGRWRINCVCEAFGKILAGDRFSGKIGYLDRGTYTEFGNTIQADLISPPIHGDGATVQMPLFEMDVQTGVGATSGQGSDPQIMLSISDDGGETFEGPEMWESMGMTGVHKHRLAWHRLGSFEGSRCLRAVITDPVPRTIMGARCPGLVGVGG